MKNALLTGLILVVFAVAFVAGLITQQRLGLIGTDTTAKYSPESVMNLSRSSYIEGYHSGAEAALSGRFENTDSSEYKEALTWRLDHPGFPFISEPEPGQ